MSWKNKEEIKEEDNFVKPCDAEGSFCYTIEGTS